MKVLGWLLVTLGVSLTLADEVYDDKAVVKQLSDTNFGQFIQENGLTMVKFYAPWCGHCTAMKADYIAAAEILRGLDPPIYLAELDATENEDLSEQLGIKGFPTLKAFKDGGRIVIDYNGARKTDEIVDFMTRLTKPALMVPSSPQELKDFLEEKIKSAIVAFFDDDADKNMKKLIGDYADVSRFPVALASPSLGWKGVKSGNLYVVTSTSDDEVKRPSLSLTPLTTIEDIKTFVYIHSKDVISTFSMELAADLMEGPLSWTGFILLAAEDKETLNIFREPAQATLASVNHVAMFYTEEFSNAFEWFGVKEDTLPAFVLLSKKLKKVKFEGELNPKDILKFEEGYTSGRLKIPLNSEEPTEDDLKGDVKVVKGKSFESIVVNNNKDVLLLVHAAWCQDCHAFDPTFSAVVARLSESSDLVFAKMDGDLNEVEYEGLLVDEFPTLYFFRGDKNKKNKKVEAPLAVSSLEEQSIIDFAKEHACHKCIVREAAAAKKGDEEL